jgi:conjugal transfer/entry exclusion protein
LSLAKHAFTHTYDPENYSEVKDVLTAGKSKEELEKYIQSVKNK